MPGDAIANAANIIILSPFGAHVLPGSQENAQADVWQRGCDVHNLARGLHALEHLRPECLGTVNGISPKGWMMLEEKKPYQTAEEQSAKSGTKQWSGTPPDPGSSLARRLNATKCQTHQPPGSLRARPIRCFDSRLALPRRSSPFALPKGGRQGLNRSFRSGLAWTPRGL